MSPRYILSDNFTNDLHFCFEAPDGPSFHQDRLMFMATAVYVCNLSDHVASVVRLHRGLGARGHNCQ